MPVSTTTRSAEAAFAGEMAALTHAYPWETTPLGPRENWPFSLRNAVAMMLRSRCPKLIFWGPSFITLYNDAFRVSLGENGKHPGSFGVPARESWAEAWPLIGPDIESVMASGDSVWFENRRLPLRRNGSVEDSNWTLSLSALEDEGRVNGVLATGLETTRAVLNFRELTETNERLSRSLAINETLHTRLRESESRLLSLFTEAPVAIAMIERENLTFRMANPFYAELVGRSLEQLIDKPMMEALPELAGQGFDKLLQDVLDTQKPFISRGVRVDLVRDGRLQDIYVDLIYQPHGQHERGAANVLVVATDLTEQVKARQALAKNEARFRSLIEEAPIATCLFTGPDMVIVVANDQMLRYWGKGKLVFGRPLAEALPELIGQPFLGILDRIYASGEQHTEAEAHVQLVVDGRLQSFYFDYTYKPLRDESGRVYGIMDMAIDVTDRVLARRKEAEIETSLRMAVELAQLATWTVDATTGRVTYSDRMKEWAGSEESSIANLRSPVIDPSDADRVYSAIRAALAPGSSGRFDEEYTMVNRQTGEKKIIRSTAQAIYARDGRAKILSGTSRDVTAERALQLALENEVRIRTEQLAIANEQLRDANRELKISNEQLVASNEQLAQFAYVASHDLQEPLRKIQLFSNMLIEKPAAAADTAGLLGRIEKSAERMRRLITDLLNFSSLLKPAEARGRVDLNEVVEQILVDFEVLIEEKKARVTVATLPVVQGIRLQMNQLFYNLIGNALKFASPDRAPAIDIRSRRLSAEEAQFLFPGAATAYDRITVADNGIGFEPQYAGHIFEMFKRLHERDRYPGTGIGLSLARTIAGNHGGTILAESAPDAGASFHLYLPAAAGVS